ncbi:MAG: hypothetical protein KUG81_03600, partial [Gammaproteobacteria bacterium]|nr:hypothetical protein [Gammaproteobacteria bacterium]
MLKNEGTPHSRAQCLRLVVERPLTRQVVTTLVKRAAKKCGIPGGQVEELPAEFVQSVGGFLWAFNLRDIPVEVYVNALPDDRGSVTVFNVPPHNGGDPWLLARVIQRQILIDVHTITTAQPWPEPRRNKQCEKQKPKPSATKKHGAPWWKSWWNTT